MRPPSGWNMSAGFRRCQTSMTARSVNFRSGNDPSGCAQASRSASTSGAIASSAVRTSRGSALRQHEHRPADTLTGEFDEFRLVGRRPEQADLDRRRIPSDRLARRFDLGPLPERVTAADRHPAVAELGDVGRGLRAGIAAEHDRRVAGTAPASATPSSARSTRARRRTSPPPRSTAPSSRGCSRAGSPVARRRRCRAGPSPPCSSRSRRRTGSGRPTAGRRWRPAWRCGSGRAGRRGRCRWRASASW